MFGFGQSIFGFGRRSNKFNKTKTTYSRYSSLKLIKFNCLQIQISLVLCFYWHQSKTVSFLNIILIQFLRDIKNIRGICYVMQSQSTKIK
ncbi:unnamed protein product (macronuclear) [Paramecium tetraurelia]|uniref:Uncharacterized protein n=1 Tax=Paramecium tetraurelia TaxID=5888 RepID=A0EAE6_PARTE|nr:uncharacterized protein GSPATT00024995001 [Paramecium tetraurelia]CAK92263.1 unnamed protein product [Paramecium tetraurelia]|eukprot:XP_001459660.1 hypothetical protein (macronuclear) [Paramecium tetraurelia strain d4-2]